MQRTPTGDAPGAFVGAADERVAEGAERHEGRPPSVRAMIDADGIGECQRLAVAFAEAASVIWNMTDEPGELPLR